MKNFGLLVLGIILGALAMYFFCQNFGTDDEPLEPLAPKGIINPSEIKTLTQAYNPRYDTITKIFFRGIDGGDNRSSWYSLEDLRGYLDFAENEAKNNKQTMDGVRLYLGAHPTEDNRPGFTTLIFVPTGITNTSKGTMLNLNFQGGGSPDLNGGSGLNAGGHGNPPGINYPQ